MLFLDIIRPLRWPLSWLNQLVIWAVARSPFVKAARAQHVARERAFAEQWERHVPPPTPKC